MWCFVSEPNGTIHELILPQESRGCDCLDMIANRINLVEKDYFGLRYINPSANEKWLNLRNKLTDQLTGRSPHRIRLVVKFFVKIQELQQPITRDLYYATLVQHIENKKIDIFKISLLDLAKIIALKAQIEFGDFNAEALPDYSQLISTQRAWSQEIQELVETEHLKLDMITSSEAKIEFIKMASECPDYGIESFKVQSACEKLDDLCLNVRHDGLRIYSVDADDTSCKGQERNLINFIPYDEISTVSYKGKRFTIIHGDEKLDHSHSSFLLKKNHEAIKLFRTFTEYHSFFQCNTVKKSVVDKCTRTSIGRLYSIFNSGTEKGKNFLFDVIRTRRQAYDRAWSILNAPDKKRQSAFYHSERQFNRKSVYSLSKIDEALSESFAPACSKPKTVEFTCVSKEIEIIDNVQEVIDLSVEELRETVNTLIESKTCQVCMDADVSIAFCPCGHVVCCTDCAVLCRECPLCRTQITYAQRVFFSGN